MTRSTSRWSPRPGDVQSVTTLDGITHQDVAAPTFGIRVRMVVDWDTVRPGLAYYLWNNQGDEVADASSARTPRQSVHD